MDELRRKLDENGVGIRFSKAFEDYMSTEGYDPAYGARPIKRLMQRELINLIAKAILEGRVSRGSTVEVDVRDGQVVIN